MPDPSVAPDPGPSSSTFARVFAILNAQSGSCNIEDVRRELAEHFGPVELRFHELSADDDLAAVVAEALGAGAEQVVAGGGDGTISAVADHLTGSGVPFALLPLGTANVLARELGVPTDLAGACRLAAAPWVERDGAAKTSRLRAIDAMKVGERHYLTQVGVGIDALMIQNTSTEAKRRLGKLAYMMSAVTHILAFKVHRFTVMIDGRTRKLKAAQIVVANTGMMGQPPFRWGPDIDPGDGRLNVCYVNPAKVRDFMRLFWVVFRGHREKTPHIRHESFEREMTIRSRHPLPVQADGEILGDTPVTITVVRDALQVVVPATTTVLS